MQRKNHFYLPGMFGRGRGGHSSIKFKDKVIIKVATLAEREKFLTPSNPEWWENEFHKIVREDRDRVFKRYISSPSQSDSIWDLEFEPIHGSHYGNYVVEVVLDAVGDTAANVAWQEAFNFNAAIGNDFSTSVKNANDFAIETGRIARIVCIIMILIIPVIGEETAVVAAGEIAEESAVFTDVYVVEGTEFAGSARFSGPIAVEENAAAANEINEISNTNSSSLVRRYNPPERMPEEVNPSSNTGSGGSGVLDSPDGYQQPTEEIDGTSQSFTSNNSAGSDLPRDPEELDLGSSNNNDFDGSMDAAGQVDPLSEEGLNNRIHFEKKDIDTRIAPDLSKPSISAPDDSAIGMTSRIRDSLNPFQQP